MVTHTLRRMARGGMYDQLGGGFHRYSTDAEWLVPHFEKMLYDNALLARVYTEAYQLTGTPFFRTVAMETLTYLQREMTLPEGGLCAAQDADSEGAEGKYFVWTPAAIAAVTGDETARVLCEYYDVRPGGNFEHGQSVLWVPREPAEVAARLSLSEPELEAVVREGRSRLLAVRGGRVAPGRDDKVVVAWNCLAVRALVAAATVFEDAGALERARSAARFVLERATPGDLFRTWRAGRSEGRGFLDDYAGLVASLLDLYEATFETEWLAAAQSFAAVIEAEFGAPEPGGYFYTGRGHETLLARSRQPFDNATPGGNSLHAGNLLRLAAWTGEPAYRRAAEGTLRSLADALQRYPSGMAELLCALDFALGPVLQVALTGLPGETVALRREVWRPFQPRKVVAGWPAEGARAPIPLLAGRDRLQGRAAAYVCRDFTCRTPVVDPLELRAVLLETAGSASARPGMDGPLPGSPPER
jgi:uncharacterized protein